MICGRSTLPHLREHALIATLGFGVRCVQVELEDDETSKQRSSMDDEYARAGVRDPKVCVTTSRDPSSRLKQFAKEMKLVVPNAQRINRGNHKVRVVRIAGYPACHEHGLLENKSLHLGKISTQLKQQGRHWLLDIAHEDLNFSASPIVVKRQPLGRNEAA